VFLESCRHAYLVTGNFPYVSIFECWYQELLITSRFTTIDPNRAIGYLRVPCACGRFDLQSQCAPNYGSCVDGQRSVPIELLDVAGLVPGAHMGRGLGNKFLDDLRKADGLVHVVDVSGTTDAEGL
jgi:ribosome-binding ATPase